MTEYLTYKQAMEYLKIKNFATFQKILNSGLPYTEIANGLRRVKRSDIDKFMNNNIKINK